MSNIFYLDKKFRLALLLIFLAELFSLFGYLLPDFNKIAFLTIVIITLILSLYKLEYGLWLVLAELFIGSKGYLFYFDYNGLIISIRIALWLIIMSVWLGKTITNWIKSKKLEIEFLKSRYFSYFLIFFIFVIWGLVSGVLNKNYFSNVFFDFNGWLYFALIFPLADVVKSDESINFIWQIFTAAMVWLSLKTLFLLFVFSHNLIGLIYELYRWVGITGVGEITLIRGGFYRIFFQSHIFILISFFIWLLMITQLFINKQWKQNKKFFTSYFLPAQAGLLLTFLLSLILISFSRSFWVGFALGIVFLWVIYLFIMKVKFKEFFIMNSVWLAAMILAFGLIIAIVKFPYPRPVGGFDAFGLLGDRASQVSGEAAASSRWSLLPQLWAEIRQAPILGKGFGATVTYKSSDHRVIESNPTGLYTTYAFEWGWLDIWLKLGLLGMIFYLILIGRICFDGLRLGLENKAILGLTIGLVVVASVSIFSPYTNHPLGIGYLILTAVFFDFFHKN